MTRSLRRCLLLPLALLALLAPSLLSVSGAPAAHADLVGCRVCPSLHGAAQPTNHEWTGPTKGAGPRHARPL